MTNSPPNSNVDEQYKTLMILKIKELKFYENAKFMHSVYHNIMPLAFQDYFQSIHHSHNTRTRTYMQYYVPLSEDASCISGI